jgi:transposase
VSVREADLARRQFWIHVRPSRRSPFERLRDLVRCRDDLRGDLMRARHRISKFLLRRELYQPAGGSWTQRHRDWLVGLRFDDRASELCLADYLHAHDVLLARRGRLDESLTELARESPWSATIARLRCLRGIDALSALGLCAEVTDWGRFGSREAIAAFLGLVPSENSPASGAAKARSPRPAPPTPAGCWSRRLTTTAASRGARPRSSGASAARKPGWWTSAGASSGASTAAADGCRPNAARGPASPRSRWRASSPASVGSSPSATDPSTTPAPAAGAARVEALRAHHTTAMGL